MGTNLMDMLSGMAQTAPQMQQMAGNFALAMQQMTRMLAELVKQNSPASGYDVKTGITTDKYEDNTFLFNLAPRAIDLLIEGNDIAVQLSYDGVAYEKEFVIKSATLTSLSITCRGFRVRSRNTGAAGNYQAVVFA